jgi:hypothetical protein
LEPLPTRDVPAEGIGEANDHVEESADQRSVAQRLLGNTCGVSRLGVGERQFLGPKRELLEERERRGELGTEWRRAPVLDDRLPDLLTECVRRNCAV